MTTYARAHTNIALIKYWGKADKKLMLPATSSISLTLNDFYTDTAVTFDSTLSEDHFVLNDQPQSPVAVSRFLDHVRKLANIKTRARVSSLNHVPTAAGLASSASAFAALALAASRAAGLNLSPIDLSRLARRGSGSATRSIFGGAVIWHRALTMPLHLPNPWRFSRPCRYACWLSPFRIRKKRSVPAPAWPIRPRPALITRPGCKPTKP